MIYNSPNWVMIGCSCIELHFKVRNLVNNQPLMLYTCIVAILNSTCHIFIIYTNITKCYVLSNTAMECKLPMQQMVQVA